MSRALGAIHLVRAPFGFLLLKQCWFIEPSQLMGSMPWRFELR
jgi:hypothetical protein